MPYTVTTTLSKTSDTVWWGVSDPTGLENYDAWVATQPGYISHTLEKPDDDNRVATLVMETESDYVNFMAASAALPISIARSAYMIPLIQAGKITQSSTFITS